MKPVDGTFSNNATVYGVAGINVDGCRIPHETIINGSLAVNSHLRESINGGNGGHIFGTETKRRIIKPNPGGRWPANIIHDGSEEVLAGFPENTNGTKTFNQHETSACVARFFYCAKASNNERTNNGKVDNRHPTVKPIALMKYLVTMVTMPETNLVLDPFMGSGTTGLACLENGDPFIGVEKDKDSFDVAKQRIQDWFDKESRKLPV